MAARPDACEHTDWFGKATVHRDRDTEDGPVTAWAVDFEMVCFACLTPMGWNGYSSISDGRTLISLICQPFDVDAAGGTT